ncbi:MAG: hypothetical protein Q7T25_08760, partial [Sideroxyarcus sp.]|nr:hypothetical protein [Sideroxyarcus sp.]
MPITIPTLTAVNNATGGTEDTYFGISYATLKGLANESAGTDGFFLTGAGTGTLWYNTGTLSVPVYVAITNFADVKILITGIYVGATKVSASDAKLYWQPVANTSGTIAAFTVRAYDNGDGTIDAGTFTDANVDGVNDNGVGAGSDSRSSADITVNVVVAAVNDAPVNTLQSATGTTAEAVSLVFNAANANLISVNDVDTASLTTIVSVSNGTLAVTAIGHGATITNPGTAAVTIAGTIVQVNAALDGLTYTATPGTFNGSDTLAVATNDGTVTTTNNVAITITSVNTAPAIAYTAGDQSLTGGATTKVFSTGNANTIVVSDVDAGAATNLVATVSVVDGTVSAASDATVGAGNALAAGAGTSSMTLTGSLAEINASLDGLTYTTPGIFDGADVLTVVINDAGNTGSGTALNSAPTNINIGVIPLVTAVNAPAPGNYNAPDVLNFTVVYDTIVNVATGGGFPTIAITVGATPQVATYTGGTGTTNLTFSYTVQAGDTDANGVAVNAGSISLNGGTITFGAANASTALAGIFAPTAAVVVDTVAPLTTISLIDISADTGTSATDFITATAAQTITGTLSATLAVGEILYGSVDGGVT